MRYASGRTNRQTDRHVNRNTSHLYYQAKEKSRNMEHKYENTSNELSLYE